MRQLLSFQERRIVNILYSLTIDHEYMTLKQIQEMNECSDRTVQSDIDTIKDFWGGRIAIRHFEQAVFLENRSLGKLHQYIYEILQQSLTCNLLISIFFNPEENMDFHAMQTHISTSHAQRTLSDINSFLNRHNIMISKTGGKHFLEGNSEMNLRFFMTEFLIQYQPIMNSFKNREVMLTLIKVLEEAFIFHKIKLNELLLNQLSLAFYLSIIREKQGFKMIDSEDQFSNFDFNLPEDFKFTKYEVKAGLNQFNDLIFLHYNNHELRERVSRNVKTFTEIESFGGIIQNPNDLSDSIFLYMLMVYVNNTKLERLLDRSVLFGQESQKMKTDLFEIVHEQIATYDPNFKNFVLEHLDVLIFWVSLTLPKNKLKIPKKILVISDLGKDHATGLKDFIKTYFSYHHFTCGSTLLGLDEDVIKNIDSFDLIISTTILVFDTKVPIVEINDFVSPQDLQGVFMALR